MIIVIMYNIILSSIIIIYAHISSELLNFWKSHILKTLNFRDSTISKLTPRNYNVQYWPHILNQCTPMCTLTCVIERTCADISLSHIVAQALVLARVWSTRIWRLVTQRS